MTELPSTLIDIHDYSTTTDGIFEENQRRWVRLVLCGRAPFSSHLLEALLRRKSALEANVKRQSEKVQSNIEHLLANPTEASSGVGKALKDSGSRVTQLVEDLRNVERATKLVEVYLSAYPSEPTESL